MWSGKRYNKKGKIDFEINEGNGKLKYYHDNGKLYLEGEYLNGKENGKVKEYYDNGRLNMKVNI